MEFITGFFLSVQTGNMSAWAQLWGDRAWIPWTPGFGLNPKSGLEKQRSGIHLHGLTIYSSCKLPCLQTQWTLTENFAVTPACPPNSPGFSDTCLRWRGRCEERGEIVGTRSYLRPILRSPSKSFLGICSSENPRGSQGR